MKLEKKTVVCFGDSNTFGWLPTLSRTTSRRYAADRRWPGVLAKRLGGGFQVIEEGQVGRTTVHPDPIEGAHRNGRMGLAIVLETHMPIDLLIIMLGTNDLKARYAVQAADIIDSIEDLVRLAKASGAGAGVGSRSPGIMLVSPPPIREVGRFVEMFAGGEEKAARLPALMKDLASRIDVPFLDASEIIEVSAVDGIHLDLEAHRLLGIAVADKVKSLRL